MASASLSREPMCPPLAQIGWTVWSQLAEEFTPKAPEPEPALQTLMRGHDHLEGGIPPEVEALATQLMAQAHAQGQAMTAIQAGWAAAQALAREPVRDLPVVGTRLGEADLARYLRMPTLDELPLTEAEQAKVQEGRRSWWGKHGLIGRGPRGMLSLPVLAPMTLVGSDFLQGKVHGIGMDIWGLVVLALAPVMLWTIWRTNLLIDVPDAYAARKRAWYRSRVARLAPAQRDALRQDKAIQDECRLILEELAHGD